eukprot:1138374-Pelagomonas_calceolata.AAC.7
MRLGLILLEEQVVFLPSRGNSVMPSEQLCFVLGDRSDAESQLEIYLQTSSGTSVSRFKGHSLPCPSTSPFSSFSGNV